MDLNVTGVKAVEILDSRGNPTLAVTVTLGDGTVARAGVPSGASTGSREAVELRDGDPARFGGKGVLKAVANVNGEIAEAITGRAFADLAELDSTLIELDGTENKARLGANAIVGVSMAAARAIAACRPACRCGGPSTPPGVSPRLPVPHFNVVNGGAHAPNKLDFQEFMVAPLGAPSMAEAVRAGAEVYAALRKLLSGRGLATGLGDEGGFAPEIDEPEEVLGLLVAAIEQAGYRPGPRRRGDRPRPGRERVLPRRRLPRRRRDPLERRHDRPLREDHRRLPGLEPRGRPRRGRLGRLGAPHRAARRPPPDRGRRPARHEPGDHRRGDRTPGGELPP